MVTTTLAPAETVSNAPSQRPGFRKDIQGLRAIAVGAVLLFHLWPNRVPGGFAGVDVFFVISGFLITSHLLRRPPRRLRDFGDFWARRVGRLLPASLSVLAVTVLATWWFAPVSVWKETAKQVIASALYVQNWALASDSIDYLAADNIPTSVQHYWSLSIEEQFYFFWPLVVALVVALAASRRWDSSRALFAALLSLAVASFVYNIWLVTTEPALAYFVTPARIWELVAGGVLAVAVAKSGERSSLAAAALAWIGVIGIGASFFIITPEVPFPGAIALLPVLSTVLVIGAHATSKYSPTGILGIRPVQAVGDSSYSIYLWHWPFVVILPSVIGTLWWGEKLLVIAVTLVLAWWTMKLIEHRFRASRFLATTSRSFMTGGVGMAIVVTLGSGLYALAHAQEEASQSALHEAFSSKDPCLGAGTLITQAYDPSACPPPDELILGPVAAKSDKSVAYEDDCWTWQPYGARKTCTYGDGPTNVALIGNSHAGHWLPALTPIAEKRGWTITTFLVDRCNASAALQDFDTEDKALGCFEWGQWVLDATTSGDFDLVVTSERQSLPVQGYSFENTEDAAIEGYVPFLEAWRAADLPVIVIRDTPFPGSSIPDCVAEFGADASECQGTRGSWAWMDPLASAVRERGYERQYVIDPTAWLCPDDVCLAAIGGVITYFDGSHLTATYSRTLSPLLDEKLTNLGDPILTGP